MKKINEAFVGSLTGISNKEQEKFLENANKDIKNKRFNKLKVSISPNLVNKDILKKLKKYNVSTIELEVQSTNEYILKRCGYTYNFEQIKK